MVEEPARRAHSFHKQRLERMTLEYSFGPHFALALLHTPSKSFKVIYVVF
jgi:hypothetical protein